MFVVLFDLEGTLVNCFASYRKFIDATKEKLIDLGVPSCELGDPSKSSSMINKGLDYVEQQFNTQDSKIFHSELDQFLIKYELRWAEQSSNFPDTVPTLQRLQELNRKIGLVTNTSRIATNRILEKNKIGNFFDVIVTRNEVKRLKPDPEGILIALQKINGKNFFFIGDLIFDLRATENLGGISIIIDRNSSKLNFGADYIINTLAEIPEIVLNHRNL